MIPIVIYDIYFREATRSSIVEMTVKQIGMIEQVGGKLNTINCYKYLFTIVGSNLHSLIPVTIPLCDGNNTIVYSNVHVVLSGVPIISTNVCTDDTRIITRINDATGGAVIAVTPTIIDNILTIIDNGATIGDNGGSIIHNTDAIDVTANAISVTRNDTDAINNAKNGTINRNVNTAIANNTPVKRYGDAHHSTSVYRRSAIALNTGTHSYENCEGFVRNLIFNIYKAIV